MITIKSKLILRFIIAHFKAQVEYRFSFFVNLFVQVFAYAVTFINMWLLFNKINNLNGWTFNQVIFLWNLNVFSYGICGLFISAPTRSIEGLVQSGNFDMLLTKPISPLLHLLLKNLSPIFLAHIAMSCVIFAAFFHRYNIAWSFSKVCFLILVIIGCVLIQSSIMIISGSLSFWIVKSLAIMNTLTYGLRNFILYPISIYDKFIQIVLTFIIPYAFICYYPAIYFFDKRNESIFHPCFQYGTPIVGIIMLALSVLVWNIGVNRYQSTGS